MTQNPAATLPLACGDRNGDPLTHAIVANPLAGALGAIDRKNSRVFYNPFSGYLGPDSVRFQVTAAGLPSNVATLDLSVVARRRA